MMRGHSTTWSAVAALLALGGAAAAIEQDIGPGTDTRYLRPPPEATPAEAGTPTFLGLPFDIAFGIAGTSDYVSRGITNSATDPAIQGYIEPSLGPVYFNVWASNVDFGSDEFEGAEIDTAIGVRHEIGPASLNFGYVHYFYAPEDVSPDYGELFGKGDFAVNDFLTLGARVYFAPDFNQSGETATWVAGGAKVSLPYDISVYGGVGYQFFEDPNAFEQLAWTAGASYNWKVFTFDVRYWDTDLSDDECVARSGVSNGCDATIVGTVSIDTSWSGLRDLFTPKPIVTK
jgi:uncharacterized protein (TIGR02001 family)